MKANIILVALILTGTLSATAQINVEKHKAERETLRNELTRIAKSNETIANNLETFDGLDFVVFTNQEWVRLHESHSEEILVHWPDGSTATGIEQHIEDLKKMFVYAPDTRIKEHPIKVGSGNLTAVMGIMEGTFTELMPNEVGKYIEPTKKLSK